MKIKYKVWLFFIVGICFFSLLTVFVQASFPDIQGHKYQEAIEFLQERKIVAGYPDGYFRPENAINRAELLTIIVGQKYQNLVSKDCFSDVKATEWYAKFVCKGYELGIIAGYPDGAFRPEQNVNFVEALIMLQRAQGLWVDASTSPWFKNSVESASEMNIIPLDIDFFDEQLSRGQITEMMTRILKYEENTLDAYLGIKKDYIVTYEDIEQNRLIENFWQTCQGEDTYSCRNTTPPSLPTEPSAYLKSNLLKSDSQGQKIISSHQALNFNDVDLYTVTNGEYMNSLPYKMYLGMNMIGYQIKNEPTKYLNFSISLLKYFQEKNNLANSTTLDEKALLLLDEQIYKKENQIAGYAQKMGTLFTATSPKMASTKIPKDYIGWIFYYPLEVLPNHLIENLTPFNYLLCISGQCVGSIKKTDGSDFTPNPPDENTYERGDFHFYPDIFPSEIPPEGHGFSFSKSTNMAHVLLHEFAHYIDGGGGSYSSNPQHNQSIVNTKDFLSISFMPDNNGSFAQCAKRKNNDVKSFITRYPFNGKPSIDCTTLGTDYGAPYEDFAESFAAYVTAGNIFRAAANQNTDLGEKYQWLKKNVFNGQEYDTSLPFGVSYDNSGCPDAPESDPNGGPHYVSCSNDFIWDGELRKLP